MTDKEQVIAFYFMITGVAVMLFIQFYQINRSYRECIKTDRVDCIRILNPNL